MQLFIRFFHGKTKLYDISPNYSVLDLKQKITDKENIPSDDYNLYYCSKLLECNEMTLVDAGITDEATITIMMKLKGGTGANIIPPIRCVSCGNVIGSKHLYFSRKLKENGHGRIEYFNTKQRGKSYVGLLLDEMGIHSQCCRREFITCLR